MSQHRHVSTGVVHLVPERCRVLPLKQGLLQLARAVIPRAMWWLCACLNALDLQSLLPPLRWVPACCAAARPAMLKKKALFR